EGLVAHYQFEDGLDNSAQTDFGAGTVIGTRPGEAGGSIAYEAGVTGQAAYLNGSTGIQLPNGLIANHSYTVSFWLKPEQVTPFTTTFFGARTTDDWISLVPYGHDFVHNNTLLWSRLQM